MSSNVQQGNMERRGATPPLSQTSPIPRLGSAHCVRTKEGKPRRRCQRLQLRVKVPMSICPPRKRVAQPFRLYPDEGKLCSSFPSAKKLCSYRMTGWTAEKNTACRIGADGETRERLRHKKRSTFWEEMISKRQTSCLESLASLLFLFYFYAARTLICW